MPTREEIKGVIDAYTDDVCLYRDNPCEHQGKAGLEVYCSSAECSYKCLMKRLGELGVVIRVGEEELEAVDTFGATYKTKCVAVEPLIET